ncbi:MAG: DUF6893 family small protein [Chloroflexota bacterium]
MRSSGAVFMVVVAAVAALVATQLPDIKRYLKMRSM